MQILAKAKEPWIAVALVRQSQMPSSQPGYRTIFVLLEKLELMPLADLAVRILSINELDGEFDPDKPLHPQSGLS